MKFNRVVILLGLSMILFACFGSVRANMLVLQPVDGNFTGKYFCNFDIAAKILYVDNKYNSAMYSIKYNNIKETLTHKSYGSFGEKGYNDLPNQIPGTLYYHLNNQNSFNKTNTGSIFSLKGNYTGQTETTLLFVDKNGNNVTSFACSDQSSNLQVVGRVDSLAKDCNTLTGTQGITIAYEACPCNLDEDVPLWRGMLASVDSNSVVLADNSKIQGLLNVTGLVVDRNTTEPWAYRFSGNNITYSNYVSAPSDVDNQFGVNSGSITVQITYQDVAYGDMNGKSDVYALGSGLKVNKYVGTNYGNKMTWNNNDRGYWINFMNSTGFLVEKQVKIKIHAGDNGLNVGSNGLICKHGVNSGIIAEYTINKPEKPEIEWIYPQTGFDSVNPSVTVSMKLSDDWAGIDTGSLVVWATYPVWVVGDTEEDTGEWISITKEYSGDFFTGGMFELTGNGQPGLGNSGSYVVTFTLTGLTESTGIILSGYVEDLADNFTGSQISFETRMPCSAYGCRDSFFIRQWNGEDWINNPFKGFVIFVTGSDMIELIGENNEVLMCGGDLVPAYLTGNIKMFDNEGNEIQSDYEITRLNDIYITGLDVLYYEDTKTLSIDD